MNALRAHLSISYAAILALLLILVYPIAAVPFAQWSLEFDVQLPAPLILSLLALPIILAADRGLPRWLRWSVGIYLLALLIATLTGGFQLALFQLLSWALVPWAIAALLQRCRLATARLLVIGLAIYWLTQVISGYTSLAIGREVIGLAGNRNWMAALLITTAPWAIYAIFLALARWLPRHPSRPWISAGIVAVVTLPLLHAASSRAAWVAIVALGVWALWVTYSWRIRALLSLFLVLALATSALLFAHGFVRVLQADIRVPVAARTLAMISDHDLLAATAEAAGTLSIEPYRELRGISGVGPGNYRRAFTPYRAASTYGRRLVAAATTIHPHNELLNILAQIGVIGLAGWLLLWWPLLRGPLWPDPLTGCARLSGILLLAHAMFDMTLVQPPLNILGWLLLGICWRRHLVQRSTPGPHPPRWRSPRLVNSLAVLLLICATLLTIRQLRFDTLARQAALLRRQGAHAEAFASLEAALRWNPRDISALYQAGALQLEQLKQPEGAIERLTRLRQIEPDYAHVHSLLAYAYLLQGDLQQALVHARRECQLYPFSPVAWQKLINYLAAASQVQDLPPTIDRLNALYIEKVELRYTREGIQQQLDAWHAAVAAGNAQDAVDIANQLTSELHVSFLDPLFSFVAGPSPWPPDFLYDRYNIADMAYWQQLRLTNQLLQTVAVAPEPESELRMLVNLVHKQLRLNPESAQFPYLTQLWDGAEGHPLAGYCGLAFVIRMRGWWMDIARSQQGHPLAGIVYSQAGAFRVDLISGDVTPLEPAAIKEIGVIRQTFFYLQEYMLKNRVLGLLVHAAEPDRAVTFQHYPVLQLWMHRTMLNGMEPPPYSNLPNYVVPDQIRYFAMRLQQQE